MFDDTTFRETIRRVRAGDQQVAAELVRDFEPLIRREVRLRLEDIDLRRIFDSMDIYQSVLASFFVRAAAGEYDLERPEQLIRLLVRMPRNKVASAARKQYQECRDTRKTVHDEATLEGIAGMEQGPSRQLAHEELLVALRGQMTPDVRQFAELRAEGLSWDDIAERLGGKAQAPRMQWTRGLRVIGIALMMAVGLFARPVKSELLLYYDFNDASDDSVANDLSDRNNHGQLRGDFVEIPVYTPSGDGFTGQAGDRAMDFGLYNNGAYIDVVTAIDGAFDSITNNDTFTLQMWIRGSDEQGEAAQPQWNFFAGPSRQFGAHIPWEDGTIYFDVGGCCGRTQRIRLKEPDASNWNDERWNHYAFVKDHTYTAIYQNGELFHDSGLDEKRELSTISELYIGSGPWGDRRSYSGFIDDLAIWDTVVSEEDILKLANGTIKPGGGGVRGDFNSNGQLDGGDIDLLGAAVQSRTNPGTFDLNGDAKVDAADRRVWVATLKKTWFGDANLNGEFNSADFVAVFTAGKYEIALPAGWTEGDWNGDAKFNSSDFVAAFSDGGYELGPRPAVAAVPEPTGIGCAAVAMLMLMGVVRRC